MSLLTVLAGEQRVPQYCVSCMERRFSQPVSKENRALSRDGRVRMPSGEREYEASYAQEPIEFKGERLKKPVVELSSDSAGIQFQRLKQGHTCFGRIREELPKGGLTVYLSNEEAMKLPSGQRLAGVTITIEFTTRNCASFDEAENTITLDMPFPKKFFSQTSYYVFQSSGTTTFTEPLIKNDSIAKLRWQKARDRARIGANTIERARRTRAAQENTIMADVWGPPCKIESLGVSWNVETLTGPQRRLQNNCLNYVNSLVEAAQQDGMGGLVDHTAAIREARALAICMGTHPRCGEVSPLFRFLHGQRRLVQRIARMADIYEHLPMWLLDTETSRHLSSGMQLPFAVCVADFPEEKVISLRQARVNRIAADRERLLQLGGSLQRDSAQAPQKSDMLRKMGNSSKSMSFRSSSSFPGATFKDSQPGNWHLVNKKTVVASAISTNAHAKNNIASTEEPTQRPSAAGTGRNQTEPEDKFRMVEVHDPRAQLSSGKAMCPSISASIPANLPKYHVLHMIEPAVTVNVLRL